MPEQSLLQENSQSPRQELALLIDISTANNSSKACQMVDDFVAQLPEDNGMTVDLHAGNLLLTKGILVKIKQQLQRSGANMGTVYSSVPQTQQAALDEGLYVKEKLQSQWSPLRQALPIKTTEKARPRSISPEITGAPSTAKALNVHLPDFSPSAKKVLEDVVASEAVSPAPTSELAAIEIEIENANALFVESPVEKPMVPETVLKEIFQDSNVVDDLPSQEEVALPETAFETLYLRQTLRSGQTVRFNGHVIIIGDVHAGSEITAGGDIIVWGELRGIAHAGAKGNFKSEIRAMKIEALQLRIADYIARRPDRIYYHKDGAETVISPEIARVADGEIKIFKTLLSKN